jgi:DNA-binding response OmpR family regulator/predicted regulator of Ras-like GTPase activity (Roadblock/LC7/MglB family)
MDLQESNFGEEFDQVTEYSILIADANPDTIQQLSGILRANGFQAGGTSSGDDALATYMKNPVDLVITDLELIDKSGLQLLSDLKDFDPKANVLITSSFSDKDTLASAFRMGALEFLEKPIDHQFLVTKIRDLLAKEDRALEGDLKMMSLASIIQINCEERNLAQLILNHQGAVGEVYFKDGEMAHAESGNHTGDEAVFELLSWDAGSFQVRMGVEPPTRTINKGWSGLLLEGMRRIDEATAGWSPEWEEEPESPATGPKSDLELRIAKALSNIRDVESALILSSDGIILAQDKVEDPESDQALGELIKENAEKLAEILESGSIDRIVLSGSDKRILLHIQRNNFYILTMAKKSSAVTIYKLMDTVFKRYGSA